jgi:hypothetical protein
VPSCRTGRDMVQSLLMRAYEVGYDVAAIDCSK